MYDMPRLFPTGIRPYLLLDKNLLKILITLSQTCPELFFPDQPAQRHHCSNEKGKTDTEDCIPSTVDTANYRK